MNATNQRCAARRVLYAVSATPFAAPLQQAAPGTTEGLLRVVVALLVNLGVAGVASVALGALGVAQGQDATTDADYGE